MGMPYNLISPNYEGTLKNQSVEFHLPDGQVMTVLQRDSKIYNWVSEWKMALGAKSTVIMGADGWPRAFTDTVYEPKFSIKVPSNMAVAMYEFAQLVDGTGNILVDIKSFHAKISVYKLIKTWKPEMPDDSAGGAVTMVDLNGNCLGYDPNYKKSILPK